jgi:hypothetical protein
METDMTAIEKLTAEIEKTKARLTGLELALVIIRDEDEEDVVEPPKQLSAPKKYKTKTPKQATADDGGNFEVNDISISLTEIELQIMALFTQASGEVVPATALAHLFDGRIQGFYNAATGLKRKLEPCKATIENVRGNGYRLANTED